MEPQKNIDIERLIDEALPLTATEQLPEGFGDRLLAQLRIQAAAEAETRWFRRRALAAAVIVPTALLTPLLALILAVPVGNYPGGHGLADYAASQVFGAGHPVATGAMPVVWMVAGMLAAGTAVALVSGFRRAQRNGE